MTKTILIVEDEKAIRDLLSFSLQHENYNVIHAETVTEGKEWLAKNKADLILLDWMLPDDSGLSLAKHVKKHKTLSNTPIIMLTAKAEEEHKLKGFNSGVDDYITKPFSPKVLLARIKAVMRRGGIINPDGKISFGALNIDTNTRQVFVDGKALKLSPTEFQLLYFFVTHQQQSYSREQILNHVWGYDTFVDERTVDATIRRLRKGLTQYGLKDLIQTVRGHGYRLNTDLV